MKCKSCKRDIPDESIFCLHCGEKVVKSRAKKKEVSVPKPRQLSSGTWFAQMMVNGERLSVSGATEAEYYSTAKAIKAGVIEASKAPQRVTLKTAVRNYIDDNSHVLSPSTIRGYEIIYRNRFRDYMDADIHAINFQAMINAEALLVSPKTVSNAWALVSSALENAGVSVSKIRKPMVVHEDPEWLDYEQIKVFLDAIKGDSAELAALLALHGLRLSEIMDLDVSQITADGIVIRGATLYDKDNKLVHKDSNKNKASRRVVPILIPSMQKLLPPSGKAVVLNATTIGRHIKNTCINAGLPPCSPHDLRRSFASLAFHLGWNAQTTMQLGGWSNMQTVNAVYRKLAEKDKGADVEKMQRFYADND